jgi:hypothetical protein
MANGVLKNLSFHIAFKNVNLILVKSAPNKIFFKQVLDFHRSSKIL